MNKVDRRRFILLSAAAATLPATRVLSAATWRGRALGATAQLHVEGLSAAEAAPLFTRIAGEIERLENP